MRAELFGDIALLVNLDSSLEFWPFFGSCFNCHLESKQIHHSRPKSQKRNKSWQPILHDNEAFLYKRVNMRIYHGSTSTSNKYTCKPRPLPPFTRSLLSCPQNSSSLQDKHHSMTSRWTKRTLTRAVNTGVRILKVSKTLCSICEQLFSKFVFFLGLLRVFVPKCRRPIQIFFKVSKLSFLITCISTIKSLIKLCCNFGSIIIASWCVEFLNGISCSMVLRADDKW